MLRIKKFQNYLKKNNIDYFLINRTDEFLGEYIAPYAERLKWLTGFSGSAGRAIISQSSAILFVDGRYTFQAKEQIDHKKIILKHINNYWKDLQKLINLEVKIGIYAKHHSIQEINKIKNLNRKPKSIISFLKKNPIDCIWKNQPRYPNTKIFNHPIKFAGEDRKIKIKRFQSILKNKDIDYYILSSLDSIAWLLNIRGNDIQFTPLAFTFILIPKVGKLTLFCSYNNIKKNLIKDIKNFCTLKELKEIYKIYENIPPNKSVFTDYHYTSFYFKNLSQECNLRISHLTNPCIEKKAVKNHIELKGARKANIRDGVSMVKFLFWLKKTKEIKEITEIDASRYLLKLRRKNFLFHSLSFDTISAMGKHSAIPHYRVSENSNISLKKNNIYLVDSGAQYMDGTTDITRTIILGKSNDEHKDRFTRVLKGHIGIATHVFKKGSTGADIDYLARKSLNEIGCDYDHGTGHGIGSFLNVHEGPQRIAKKTNIKSSELLPGMIISNEPGYYKEHDYGIRIENLLIVTKKNNSTKLQFETISFAPIDSDLINKNLLNTKEIKWINKYHSNVYKKLKNFLNLSEKHWLKKITKPL